MIPSVRIANYAERDDAIIVFLSVHPYVRPLHVSVISKRLNVFFDCSVDVASIAEVISDS